MNNVNHMTSYRHMKKRLILAAYLTFAANTTHAQTGPLADVAYISEGIVTAGMALKIEEQCPSIAVRLLRGYAFLNGLKSHAEGLGYSEEQIDAYLDDKAEENRLRAIALSRLSAKGATEGDAESYCAVGRSEMAANSQLGRLLR